MKTNCGRSQWCITFSVLTSTFYRSLFGQWNITRCSFTTSPLPPLLNLKTGIFFQAKYFKLLNFTEKEGHKLTHQQPGLIKSPDRPQGHVSYKCQVQRYSPLKETGVCVLKVSCDLWSNKHIMPGQNVLGLIFHCCWSCTCIYIFYSPCTERAVK